MASRNSPQAPILVTMGEPAGIGPEVAVAAFRALGGRVGGHPLKLVGDTALWRAFGKVGDEALIESHPLVEKAVPGRPDLAKVIDEIFYIEGQGSVP